MVKSEFSVSQPFKVRHPSIVAPIKNHPAEKMYNLERKFKSNLNKKNSIDHILGQILLGMRPKSPKTNPRACRNTSNHSLHSTRESQKELVKKLVSDFNLPSISRTSLKMQQTTTPTPHLKSPRKVIMPRNEFLTTIKQPASPLKVVYGLPIIQEKKSEQRIITDTKTSKQYGIKQPLHI